MERLGVDCADPDFWQEGIEAIQTLIGEAESEADRVAARAADHIAQHGST
jgi:hypothetical protein